MLRRAGHPSQPRSYGLAESAGSELELPGFPVRELQPVRIGNAAADQLQLDVYGEPMDSYMGAKIRLQTSKSWSFRRPTRNPGEEMARPDKGIWEVRSNRSPSRIRG